LREVERPAEVRTNEEHKGQQRQHERQLDGGRSATRNRLWAAIMSVVTHVRIRSVDNAAGVSLNIIEPRFGGQRTRNASSENSEIRRCHLSTRA
jgi:hypothetical protein